MKEYQEVYTCVECGYESSKWFGQCPQCKLWGTLKKSTQPLHKKSGKKAFIEINFSKVFDVGEKIHTRISTASNEFDRVLGGGIVPGEVILIGGEPGIGKTTLLLQLLNRIHKDKKPCFHISAEESVEQISLHAKRLEIKKDFSIAAENDIDSIINTLHEKKPALVVLDSIQTVKTEDMKGLPGGIGQVKECAHRMVEYAKKTKTPVFLVGHITKGGDLAGPKVLEHIVDAVLQLEGDVSNPIRLIRSVKNRFGSTREVGVFTFNERGFHDAENPSEVFTRSEKERVGICKGALFEGNRVILTEIQALTSKTNFSIPQRIVSGIKKSKIQMLSAVLSKYTNVALDNMDIYVNVANGLFIDDSSVDLAVCIALASSYLNKTVKPSMIAIGEVSLTGEVYKTTNIMEKLKVLRRLGYDDFVLPQRLQTIKENKHATFFDTVSSLNSLFKKNK